MIRIQASSPYFEMDAIVSNKRAIPMLKMILEHFQKSKTKEQKDRWEAIGNAATHKEIREFDEWNQNCKLTVTTTIVNGRSTGK